MILVIVVISLLLDLAIENSSIAFSFIFIMEIKNTRSKDLVLSFISIKLI